MTSLPKQIELYCMANSGLQNEIQEEGFHELLVSPRVNSFLLVPT